MPEITVEQAIQLGVKHHQAGRLKEAAEFYRQVLEMQPKNTDALHLLGVTAAQYGRADVAVDLIQKAIAINPSIPEFYGNLANAYRAQGKRDEALKAYNTQGNLLIDRRRFDDAAAAFRATVLLKPDYAGGHYNMGIALWEKGDLPQAIDAYREALRVKPDFDKAYNNLGNALMRTGRIDEAIAAYRKGIELNAGYSDAHNNLGVSLLEKGAVEEAIAAHRQAVSLRPDSGPFTYNLGVALEAARRLDEAIEIYRRAIALDPNHAEAHYNLAHVMGDKCDYQAAAAGYEQAVRLKPQWAELHYNLGITLLLLGNHERGWDEYEWRWGAKDFPSRHAKRDRPQWDGKELDGKTILLHAEQGLGDSIQFIRYAPLVARRGGRVMVECAPDLARLVAGVQGVAEVVTKFPPPPFDVHCPLLSLPRAFGTRVDSIPADVPYVKAESADVEMWGKRLVSHPGRMKIGLAWAGQPGHKNDRNRSIALAQLAPLAAAVDATFYSLQKGSAAAETADPPAGMELIDWTPDIHDLADTAALMSHLDLVITVDTVVAHLAGALGKRVWVMLPRHSDWRWMLDREDSPWYPTMRLFRQNGSGDKAEMIARVAQSLKHGER